MIGLLQTMVWEPSVGGTDEENSAQASLARVLHGDGLEVDHWQVPLAEILAAADFPGSEVDPLMDRWVLPYPISVGRVSSGVWASSVPDLLTAEGRLGVRLGEPVEDARADLEQAVADACDRDPWLREHPAQVQWWGGQFAPGRLAADSRLVHQVRDAHVMATGARPPQVWGAPYGSDLRLMEAAGVPTVQYGPGDAALAHSTDEQVPCEEVLLAARALAVLVMDHCGLAV